MRSKFALLGLALVAASIPARAGDSKPGKQECATAYVDAQRLRKADKLGEAKEKLQVCSNEACPASLKKDCQPWLAEVEHNMPSLSFEAVDRGGSKTDGVRVELDDKPLGDTLPSAPVELDPGKHQVRFVLEGAEPIELTVDVARGEKNKSVVADFSKQAKQPEKPMPAPVEEPAGNARPIPVTVYILGGVGVLGLASFAYFGQKGKSEENNLANTCAPNCNPDDVDASHKKLFYADVSLGISVLSLGAATYLYLKRPSKSAPAATVGFTPLPGGGGAVVRGAF